MAFIALAVIGGSVAAAGGLAKLGMSLSGRNKRIQEQEDAKEQMEERMEDYENLDTSNIYADVKNQYANMENTYEDLTINQQQAQFEAQQGQQQRANIMQGLQGAAGASGIAGLAQMMASQGQLATQRASASIGMQESRIGMLQAGEASRIQTLERAGEATAERLRLTGAETARGLEWGKTGTLLGMSQQRVGAANQARAMAKAQQMGAVGDIASAGLSMATAGMKMGGTPPPPPSGQSRMLGTDGSPPSVGGGGFDTRGGQYIQDYYQRRDQPFTTQLSSYNLQGKELGEISGNFSNEYSYGLSPYFKKRKKK